MREETAEGDVVAALDEHDGEVVTPEGARRSTPHYAPAYDEDVGSGAVVRFVAHGRLGHPLHEPFQLYAVDHSEGMLFVHGEFACGDDLLPLVALTREHGAAAHESRLEGRVYLREFFVEFVKPAHFISSTRRTISPSRYSFSLAMSHARRMTSATTYHGLGASGLMPVSLM